MGKKKRKPALTAKKADRYELYQLAVQNSEAEVEFMTEVYRAARDREPRHLREDFGGTALVTSHWIRQGSSFTAEAYDIDPEPVAWAKERNFTPEELADGRCLLLLEDVREPSRRRPDLRCALNFSYRCFKSRPELLDYFRKVHEDLPDDGVFVLDTHGGPDSYMEMKERRKVEPGFTYTWHQVAYWPATGDYECRIHFSFPDGSRLKRAFTYDWRFWSIPELEDALLEAGFPDVRSYWEGTDEETGCGNGRFAEDARGENCMSWIAYVAAFK